MPDGIGGILDEIRGALGGLLGNETIKSIVMWQVLGIVAQAALTPYAAALQQELFGKNPDLVRSPQELVNAVVRGYLKEKDAEAEAAQSGINADRFQELVNAAANPPGVGELLELLRRKVIPETGTGADSISYEQGIREGQTKNKWINPLKVLQFSLPSPQDALQALLEGQTDDATARDLYQQFGGDIRFFELMFNTRGSAPTPLEAADMARRGLIPWDGHGAGVTSFEQAFLEGPWRNKWLAAYRGASQYLPPPRTVTAMIREGALTDQEGASIFAQSGLSPQLITAYLTAAHHQRTAPERELTKSEIVQAYKDRLITRAQAGAQLLTLNYPQADIDFILDLADFQLARAEMTTAAGRIGTLYLRRRLPRQDTVDALTKLGVPREQQNQLLKSWDLERAAAIPELTVAQVLSAAYYEGITPREALAELEARGYSPFDAWVALVDRFHGAPAGFPRPTGTIPEPYSR